MIMFGQEQPWALDFDISLERRTTVEKFITGKIVLGSEHFDVVERNYKWGGHEIDHPTWKFRFFGLKWLVPSAKFCIEHKAESSGQAEAVKEEIRAALKSWINWEREAEWDHKKMYWEGHTTALRTTTLVGLSSIFPTLWMSETLHLHGTWLNQEENWDGPWNHGLMQSIALFALARRLNHEVFLSTAIKRMNLALSEMIDDEGCINEQAPAYSSYIIRLLNDIEQMLIHNDMVDAVLIGEKRRALAEFAAHATEPNGYFTQLGDSFRTRSRSVPGSPLEYVSSNGKTGIAPTELNKVFKRGFIFGRSSWNMTESEQRESFYSIRFGTKRIIHGHNDHMSVTLYDYNRNIIIDSGHNGYRNDSFRNHLRSVEAHNLIVVSGLRHDWAAETHLIRESISDNYQFFQLTDQAYPSVIRTRSIGVGPRSPLIVLDHIKNKLGNTMEVRQLWHIDSDFRLVNSNSGILRATSSDGTVDVVLISYYFNGDDKYLSPINIDSGSLEPHMGWQSREDSENIPSLAPSFNVSGKDIRVVTAAFAIPAASKVGHSLRKEGARHVLRLHLHDGYWAWTIDEQGVIHQRRQPNE